MDISRIISSRPSYKPVLNFPLVLVENMIIVIVFKKLRSKSNILEDLTKAFVGIEYLVVGRSCSYASWHDP